MTMDYQRYLLIGAAAVLSYMLLIEWGHYRTAPTQPPTEISNPAIQSSLTEIESNDSDLPQHSDLPANADQTQVSVTADMALSSTNNSAIHIKTDTLDVKISREGGDIISVGLPEYYAKIDSPDQPFILLEQTQQRTYIAQSGLIGRNGTDTQNGRPTFSAKSNQFSLADSQNELVVDLFFTDENQVEITKRFRFHRSSYLIDVEYLINNRGSSAWSAGLFGQLKRDNSADPSADSSGMGMHPYLGAAISLTDSPFKKISFSDMADKPLKVSQEGGWVAMIQHYFLSAWIPNPEQVQNYSTVVTKGGDNIIRFTSPAITVEPGKTATTTAQFYAGPKDQYQLEKISKGLELSVDYGWLWWIAQPLFWLLYKLHGILGNWGFAIIAVTVLVKALFFQLNATAYKSMANMRKVQPKLIEIRERYADDKAKQSQEMMSLYKKEKINPLGGCLPILVQMPVFISLYWVLMESVELRHSPFIFWIKDLSVMDPYFILPLIMGASMFIQQKLNPPPPDPMQAKVMQWMPVMFTFFFLFFPAGLVLYWVVNNTLSIIQQYIITKRIEKMA